MEVPSAYFLDLAGRNNPTDGKQITTGRPPLIPTRDPLTAERAGDLGKIKAEKVCLIWEWEYWGTLDGFCGDSWCRGVGGGGFNLGWRVQKEEGSVAWLCGSQSDLIVG